VQTTIRAILALYLAHLLTDFVFQTSHLVQQKKDGQFVGYAKHGAIHYLCAVLSAALFLPGMIFSLRFQAAVIALTLVHLLIDVCKIQFAKSRPVADGALAFVTDQVVHFITVVLAACWIERTPLATIARGTLQILREQSNRILLLLIVYVIVMFACGYLIRFVTKPLMRHIAKPKPQPFDSTPSETPAQLSNAGMYIGWLERFLVLTALLLHSPATVGLIIAAKSIARYPQFHREQFAEYFLIGTLLSICTAFVGGVVLMRLFFGSPALPQ
jgi:tryptophan-rich sensory protein